VLVAPAVATVRPSGPDASVGPRPVVACVDERRPLPVLAAAAQEAALRGRRLDVVHVVETADQVEQAGARLRDLVRPGVPATTPHELHVVTGQVVPRVLAAAQEAAVLVVGSRGTLALAGLALGSVSHEVLRASPVPVLVARATGDRDGDRAPAR
jgi:nucleotide-binding universal stress UspA family protein